MHLHLGELGLFPSTVLKLNFFLSKQIKSQLHESQSVGARWKKGHTSAV
jgi:hypothetical protein